MTYYDYIKCMTITNILYPMASLTKIKKKSGTTLWYSRIQSVNWSKVKYIPLHTRSKVTARVRHSDVERNEKDIKNGMDISFSWDNDEGRTVVKQMTFVEGIKQWLDIKATNVSKGTHRRYIISMNAFMNVVGDVTPLPTITNQNIEDFKRYYSKLHTPAVLTSISGALRHIYGGHLMRD